MPKILRVGQTKLLATMKKMRITVLAIVGFIFTNLNAQTEKGQILISGSSSLNFSIEKDKTKSDNIDTEGSRTTTFDINPMGGYFIINNLAVGISMPIILSSSKDGDGDKSKSNSFIFGPFGRYYFDAENIKPFGQLAFGFGTLTEKYTPEGEDTYKEKYGQLSFAIDVGAAVFLNESVAIDFAFGYGSNRIKPKNNNENNLRYVTGGFGFSGGISFCF